MDKKIWLFVVEILFLLNVFAWQEVFALANSQNLAVNFLNVGQGDSAFIKTPENYQILIDGGPDSSVLEKLSFLMPFWDRSIDAVILSHPEKDHMSGLIDVLQRYKVDYVIWTGIKRDTPEYETWISLLEKQKQDGAKIIEVKSGDKVLLGNTLIDVLFPFESLSDKVEKNTSNDAGVVCRLIFGNNSFLFTGDITSKAEKELIDSKENILSDVLKISHHGSKYSTSDEFLKTVSPKIAVIEVGKNTYGHPTPEVLQKLEKSGIQVLRTDINGDVKFFSNGKNIKLINN